MKIPIQVVDAAVDVEGVCVRCGDCCEFVGFDVDGRRADLEGRAGLDVDSPEGWDSEWTPARALRARTDARFILAHWHPHPTVPGEFTCDVFDPVTRACGDHGNRPPVCANYPWYGGGPTRERADNLPARCSYRDAPALEAL